MLDLTLHFDATAETPETSLIYRAEIGDALVADARVVTGDRERATDADANVVELAFRYPQKGVSRAELAVDSTLYTDTNGDGLVENGKDQSERSRLSIWRLVAEHLELAEANAPRYTRTPMLYDLAQNLTCEEARPRLFVASCGSTVADVLTIPGHSVIWAAVPAGSRPNEVHRHLGGSVYCLFFGGQGRFHRVDPERGFETLPIQITDENSFQFIAIPTHLWYQPINTGDVTLQYFMIHEPAFDGSEQLILEESECRTDWQFEF